MSGVVTTGGIRQSRGLEAAVQDELAKHDGTRKGGVTA